MTNRPHTLARRVRLAGRLTVATLAGAVTAVAVVLATGGTPERSNQFSPAAALRATGPLSIANDKEGSAILTAAGMKPGQSATGDVVIQNSSSVDATFALAQSNVTGATLAGNLNLVVVDCGSSCDPGDPQIYTGALNGLPSTALGTFAAGVAHRYRFTVTFPNGSPAHDNALQGLTSSVQFDWSADAPETSGGGGGTTTGGTTTGGTTTGGTTTDGGTTTSGGGLDESGTGTGSLVLSLGGTSTQSSTKSVVVTASCSIACDATASGTLSVPNAARVYRFRTVKKRLRGGVRTKLILKVPRAAKAPLIKAINKRRIATARVTITVRGGGKSKTARRTVRIKKRR